MFEDYLFDAYTFYCEAKADVNERDAKRKYRAAVFYLAGAMEAFVNYLAEGFNVSGLLHAQELAFIRDETIVLDTNNFTVRNRIEFHPLEDKLKLLLKKYAPSYTFVTELSWTHLHNFKKLRDSLIHPRMTDDTNSLDEYRTLLEQAIRAEIDIMNRLVMGIYGKGIRRQLLDLIPE